MKKVLFLVNHDIVIYNFRLELVERLLEEGHEVVISSPYGERIVSDDIFKLYQAMGTFIKHKMTGNKAWVISSNFDAMRNIGLKPSQKIELMNGALDCLFCEYEVFEGKRKEFVINKKQHNHSKNHRNSKR